MSALMIAILVMGVGLAALIVGLCIWLHRDKANMIARQDARIARSVADRAEHNAEDASG